MLFDEERLNDVTKAYEVVQTPHSIKNADINYLTNFVFTVAVIFPNKVTYLLPVTYKLFLVKIFLIYLFI